MLKLFLKAPLLSHAVLSDGLRRRSFFLDDFGGYQLDVLEVSAKVGPIVILFHGHRICLPTVR